MCALIIPSPDSLIRRADSFQQNRAAWFDYLDELEARFRVVEPRIHAFVPEDNRFERLRREARELLARFPDTKQRPPLFGIPVGVKDIFHVDGFETRAGSRLPPRELQGAEAKVVSRLKDAGALILGKTVTTEFAYFAPGATRNPHQLDHTPGGSSSGSAAAVAAGLCPLALGTQTIGSITRPASFCGAVGFKPSYERISRAGVIPLAPSFDTVGFFTAEARSAQLAASVLIEDWRAAEPLHKPVFGIPEGPYLEKASAEGLNHFREICRRLGERGFEIRAVAAMNDFDEIVARHNIIVAAEVARVHAKWFAQYGELYHAKTRELIERGQKLTDELLQEALRGRAKLRRQLTELMQTSGVDVWIAPAAVGAAPRGLDSTGDPMMNLPWTHSGLPTICLRAGANQDGLPLGLQVAGGYYADESLLEWAIKIEAALDAA